MQKRTHVSDLDIFVFHSLEVFDALVRIVVVAHEQIDLEHWGVRGGLSLKFAVDYFEQPMSGEVHRGNGKADKEN